jgi:hypothetical protein
MDQAAALQEFTVEDFKDGHGEEARDVRKIRIKMHDKLRPLVELGSIWATSTARNWLQRSLWTKAGHSMAAGRGQPGLG